MELKIIDAGSRRHWRAPIRGPSREGPSFVVAELLAGRCCVMHGPDGARLYIAGKSRGGARLWSRMLRDGLQLSPDPARAPWCVIDAPAGLSRELALDAESAAAAWLHALKDAPDGPADQA